MWLWERFCMWCVGKLPEKEKIKIIDPDRLLQNMSDNAYCRGYSKLRRVFFRDQLMPVINGRKVKCWKIVKCGSEAWYDEFIPIYYNAYGQRRQRRFRRRRTTVL